ncbi:MAG: hypothetical protein GY841_04900, partial [FCB group bacterium]|nr:hypothetical protein [FCB group bacterium]
MHHLPKDVWKPQFHGHDEDLQDEDDEEAFGRDYTHHYQREDGIDEKYLGAEQKGILTPKQFNKDDPRL